MHNRDTPRALPVNGVADVAHIPVGSKQVVAEGTDSSKAKLLAIGSFVLVVILYFELDWFNQNIYKHVPWIEGTAEYINNLVKWIFGFFILSVGKAVVIGRLQFLWEPSKFLGKDYFNFLSKGFTTILFGALGVVVFFLIALNPAVHLDYSAGGEKPIVILNGNPQHFNDTTIFLPIDPKELRKQKIEVTGRHNLYRIKLDPSDASQNTLSFPNHATIDLQQFFISRDFKVALSRCKQSQSRFIRLFLLER